MASGTQVMPVRPSTVKAIKGYEGADHIYFAVSEIDHARDCVDHRVSERRESSGRDRMSIPTFMNPNHRAVVECIPTAPAQAIPRNANRFLLGNM
jgi:hypothetical protein